MTQPIRVLLVFGKLNRGGAETLAMNIYRSIDRNKIQFDFIKHTNERCDYDSEITELGGRIYSFPQYNGVNHFKYKRVWNKFFENHPEYKVIHAHMTGSALVFLPIAKKYGLFTISHSHIAKSQGGLRQKIIDIYRLPLRYISDYMFACSDIAGEWMFGKYISQKENYKVIANGIDSNKFVFSNEKRRKIREEFSIGNELVIGNVARFHGQKNHIFLIEVFKEILKTVPDAKLLLVGNGELEYKLKKLASDMKIENNVIFAGVRGDISDILCAMDVFCMTSFREGLPVSLVEAQASGLKIVCSDVISKEIKLTTLVKTVSLKEKPKKWADIIISEAVYSRENTQRAIIGAGFDIQNTSKWLEEFYINEHNKRC